MIPPPPAGEAVIGIDLGTTYSVVGYWDYNTSRVEIIANEQGNRTTPSVVSFFHGEVLVGEAAKNKLAVNPENTIYNAKRVMGRMLERLRPEDVSSWPFSLVATEDGGARYAVQMTDSVNPEGSTTREVAPQEISALVLRKLKDIAERHLKVPVKKAVITVPAYFNEPQKRATKDAGQLAGLEVLGVLAEPTAAALAYGLDEKAMSGSRKGKAEVDGWYILVFDLGGGTLDISVLKLDGQGSFVTKAITGDFHLGGEDFDGRLMGHFLRLLVTEYPGLKLTNRSMGRLRTECEGVKRMLSASHEAVLDVELQGHEIAYEVTRSEFERMSQDLLESIQTEVRDALSLSKIDAQDIDDVVLVGGSTRMPCVRSLLGNMFPGKALWCGINPDEAVAVGAAIQAAAVVQTQQDTAPPPPPPPHPSAATPHPHHHHQQPHHHHHHQQHRHHQHHPHHHQQQLQGKNVTPPSQGMYKPSKQQQQKDTKRQPPGSPQLEGGGGGGTTGSSSRNRPLGNGMDNRIVGGSSGSGAVGGGPQPTTTTNLLPRVDLKSVTPFTMGIELSDGSLDVLIPRGTPLPATRQEVYTTSIDRQKSVNIQIFEGDKPRAKDNSPLGKFTFLIPPAPAGVPKVEVTFLMTGEGLMRVTAMDTMTGQKTTVVMTSANRMTREEQKKFKTLAVGDEEGTL